MKKLFGRRQTSILINAIMVVGLLMTSFSPVGLTVAQAQSTAPGAATLVAPKATSDSVKPTFVWNAVSGATWYKLWIDAPSGFLTAEWEQASAVCSGTTCSATPDLTLDRGSTYQWWILSWNDAGEGSWSDGATFQVSYSLSKPVLVTPTGTSNSVQPVYTWNVATGATWYNLLVTDASQATVFANWYQAGDICKDTTCSVMPDTKLVEKTSYTWSVRPWNSNGYGPYSDAKTFTTPAAWTKPVLVSPDGTSDTSQPTFVWNVVAGAPSYKLWVDGPAGNIINRWFKATDICNGTSCSVTPSDTFPQGQSLNWWVMAGDETSSLGIWSDGKSFTISQQAVAPTLVSPKGTSQSTKPTYTWNAAAGATSYKLWIEDPSGMVFAAWYKASDVCSGSSCSVTPNVTLPSLVNYTWWVLSWMDNGTGKWSEGAQFTTPSSLTMAALVAPQDRSTTDPTFIWAAVPGATWYKLSVDGPSGNLFEKWYEAGSVCIGRSCGVKPGLHIDISSTAYTWKVESWSPAGYGPWSQPMTFTPTFAPSAVAAPTLVSPIGYAHAAQPTFQWDPVSGVDWYCLWVNGPGTTVVQQWVDSATYCTSSLCSYKPNVTLVANSEYSWSVLAAPAGVVLDGTWSTISKFTVDLTTHPKQPAQLISPKGTVTTQPIYTWVPSSDAHRYLLLVYGPSGLLVEKWYTPGGSELTCGSTCSPITNPLDLAYGATYTWHVGVELADGTGVWGDPMTFTLSQNTKAVVIAPLMSTSTNSATLIWKLASGTPADYKLELVDSSGNLMVNDWCSTLGCTFDANIGRYTVTGLSATTYGFRVLTYYDATHQYWSGGTDPINGAPVTFQLQQTAFNSQFNGSTTRWDIYRGNWSNSDGATYSTPGIFWDWASIGYEGQFVQSDFEVRFYRSGDKGAYSETALVSDGIAPLDSNSGSGDWYEGYLFGVTMDGYYYLAKRSGGGAYTTLQPYTQCPPLVQGNGWNTIRLETVSGSGYTILTLVVNDMPVLVYEDDTGGADGDPLTTGMVGIMSLDKSSVNESLKVDFAHLTQPGFVFFSASGNQVSAEQQALNEAAMQDWLAGKNTR